MSKEKQNQESGRMNHETHESFQVSQKIVFYDQSKKVFLLVKEAQVSAGYAERYGLWDIPGGRVNIGEDLTQALNREIMEEVGESIDYEVIGPVYKYVRTIGGYDGKKLIQVACIIHLAFWKSGEIILSGEHSESRWVSLEEVREKEEYSSSLKEILEATQKRITEQGYLEDLKRLQADFDNYKKRQQESQKELGGYLIEKLVLDIVPVLDNFRAATSHVPPEQKDSPWVTGIQYIEKQLETVLTENGVTMIEAEPGTPFDPSLHEAVGTEAGSEENSEEHKIAKMLQKGYKVGSKVVRPARVSVS